MGGHKRRPEARATLLVLLFFPAALFGQCTTIPQVQGARDRSPCTGQVVTLTGVVTGSYPPLNGFFLQDLSGDGDPATSDGIFVFQGNANALPGRGSIASATGRVVEFARSGETGSVTELDVRASATPLAKVEITGAGPLPRPLGLDPRIDTDLESREGMLVEYPASAVVEPSNQFGEFFALRYDRLPAFVRPTTSEPGTGRPVMITRGPGPSQNVKTYDLAPPLTGVLHFDFGSFRLEPLEPYSVNDGGWTPTRAPVSAGLRVASLNTERLVASLAPAALALKLSKLSLAIRNQLGSPDLIAVQEVETIELLQALAARIGNYQAVLLRSCDPGRISVGLLYRPERVRKLSERQLQTEAPQFGNGRCTLPDGRAFEQYLFDRPPLLIELEVDGLALTVVVNHWRSQIGGNDLERQFASGFLVSELRKLRDENVIVLGDFNDREDSAALLSLSSDADLVNLSWRIPEWNRYSLIFEGRSEAFDHILVSQALLGRLTGSGFAHYNSDFPAGFGSVESTSVRTADHDNPWADFRTTRP